ncbi:MAG: hypothetical protein WBB65_05580 [Anaerolineales bacterium]
MKLDRTTPALRLILILLSVFSMLLGWSVIQFDAAAEEAKVQLSSNRLDPPGPYKLYLPLVIVPPRTPSDLEITQAVQQPGNPVRLIAGRTTIVRYTLVDETVYTGVDAFLYGYREGIPLPGSPLPALNNPRTLEPVANRNDWNDTFNFELPASWTSGTVELWGSASNGTTYEIVEGPMSATFTQNDPLAVTVVPIAYTCTSGGTGTTTPTGPFEYLIEDAYKLYPVPSTDMVVHTPVTYSGPCYNGQPYPDYDADDWHNMLYAIRDVWIGEGRPNRYYYGLVDIYCGGSCIAGLGYVGWNKAAVGWNGWGVAHNGASGTHAHEVGHNHGLAHAPGCGAGDPDPSYPYASGLIGDGADPNYGYDIITDGIKPYSSYYDFMTYCSSDWISDYHNEKLYAWSQAQASMAPDIVSPPQDALLISGSLREDGSVEIRPVFQLEQATLPPLSGPYALELLDAYDAQLATYNFEMATAAADGVGGARGGDVQSFHLTIPYTPGIDQIRVVKEGEVLGVQRSKRVPPGLALAPDQARIEQGMLHATWAGPTGASYLVRLSLDGGSTWQTVGVNLDRPSIDLPLGDVAGDLRLEVLASDGIHTERIEIGPVSIIH